MNLNNTIFTPANVVVARYSNNVWSELTASLNAPTVTAMGLTQFSTFAIANAGAFTRVGVADTRLEYRLKTYPNPTQDVLNIDVLNLPSQPTEIVILDAMGRVQSSQPLNSMMRLITSDWLSGLYFIAVQRDGRLQIVDKILKK
jgi:hypothetical protein